LNDNESAWRGKLTRWRRGGILRWRYNWGCRLWDLHWHILDRWLDRFWFWLNNRLVNWLVNGFAGWLSGCPFFALCPGVFC
jgi:hypothetical protein